MPRQFCLSKQHSTLTTLARMFFSGQHSNLPVSQAIHGTMSQEVLEEAKMVMQEQLLRKAAQKKADEMADAEQQR